MRIFSKKKILLCVVALSLALFLGIFAGLTFARFRTEYTGTGGARSARGIAEYSRGAMQLGDSPYTYIANGDTILCNNLSPNDRLFYKYSVNNYKSENGETATNEVLLFVRCDFTFRVAMLSADGVRSEQYLSMAKRGAEDASVIHYKVNGDAVSQIFRAGSDDATDVPANEADRWEAIENVQKENGIDVYVQSFGFYLRPSNSVESVELAFEVTLPEQSASEEDMPFLRLYAEVNITAEQLAG